MVEADPKDIKRYTKSLWVLYKQEGNSVGNLIEYVAESLAYQHALAYHYERLWQEELRAKMSTRIKQEG